MFILFLSQQQSDTGIYWMPHTWCDSKRKKKKTTQKWKKSTKQFQFSDSIVIGISFCSCSTYHNPLQLIIFSSRFNYGIREKPISKIIEKKWTTMRRTWSDILNHGKYTRFYTWRKYQPVQFQVPGAFKSFFFSLVNVFNYQHQMSPHERHRNQQLNKMFNLKPLQQSIDIEWKKKWFGFYVWLVDAAWAITEHISFLEQSDNANVSIPIGQENKEQWHYLFEIQLFFLTAAHYVWVTFC